MFKINIGVIKMEKEKIIFVEHVVPQLIVIITFVFTAAVNI